MALSDLTGIYRNKKFEGGVGGGAQQTYGGPEPVEGGEDASADTLHAAVMGIYEKYGRSAKGIRMAKASPEYAALKGAGISVFGTPNATIGQDGKLTGGTMSISGASEEMKKKAASQYAALQGGSRGRTARTAASAISDAITSGAEVTPPNPTQNKPRVPESTPQTAQGTSMTALNPQVQESQESSKPTIKETTKGPRLDTTRQRDVFTNSRDYNENRPKTEMEKISDGYEDRQAQDNADMNARDRIALRASRPGKSGITVGEAIRLGHGKGMEDRDPNEELDSSDAAVKTINARAQQDAMADYWKRKKDLGNQIQQADKIDKSNLMRYKNQTARGDADIASQTGELVDRSQFGEEKVSKRETYNKNGREWVKNTTDKGQIGLPSKNQNEADTYNRGFYEVSTYDRRADEGTGENGTAVYNAYEFGTKGEGLLGQGSKDDYKRDASMGSTKEVLPQIQKDRFSKDVTKFTTGKSDPAEGSNLTEEEYRKKKAAQFTGPVPKA